MKAILARELQGYPDGTIWTTHNMPNRDFLPIGGFRIKRSASFSNQAAYRPNWYLAYSTITTAHVTKNEYAIRATTPEFDITIQPGTTVFVWDEKDIRDLKSLLTDVLAVQSTGDSSSLSEEYNFNYLGLQLNLDSGRGEYLSRKFKLSPMQVKAIHAIAADTSSKIASGAPRRGIKAHELIQTLRPESANPEQAITQLINRALVAIGQKLGANMCPITKDRDGGYWFIGTSIR